MVHKGAGYTVLALPVNKFHEFAKVSTFKGWNKQLLECTICSAFNGSHGDYLADCRVQLTLVGRAVSWWVWPVWGRELGDEGGGVIMCYW